MFAFTRATLAVSSCGHSGVRFVWLAMQPFGSSSGSWSSGRTESRSSEVQVSPAHTKVMLQPHGQCLPPSCLEDFIDLAKACYMSLQPLELAPAASAGGPLRHVSASRIAEIRQKVVDKYGSSALQAGSRSPRSRDEAGSSSPRSNEEAGSRVERGSRESKEEAGSKSPRSNEASSSSAGPCAAAPSQILVEFRQRGWAPHWTVVPSHFTSLEVANILEAEGCAGAYDHISRGPWAQYTMEELMLDPSDPFVIFS